MKMPKRVRPDLETMFRHDLGACSRVESQPGEKPLLATLTGTGARGLKIQTYLWHATAPTERERGAHKIQITMPGTGRGNRIHIPRQPGRLVLFCGFASQFDTWILWDAELLIVPEGISYSRSLAVSVEALTEAVASGISVSTKNLRGTVIGHQRASIVACRRGCLLQAIEKRFRLGVQRLLAGES